MIGKSAAEATAIWNKYEQELPFVSKLSDACQEEVRRDGYLKLYGGGHRHFNQWAPRGKWEKGAGPCGREELTGAAAIPTIPGTAGVSTAPTYATP